MNLLSLQDDEKLRFCYKQQDFIVIVKFSKRFFNKHQTKLKMVCEKCEKKLGKVITPDTWKSGARNTTEGGGRKVCLHFTSQKICNVNFLNVYMANIFWLFFRLEKINCLLLRKLDSTHIKRLLSSVEFVSKKYIK